LVYSEVASEPLPDELARLLKELEGDENGAPDG
jgi:Anti-sigma factor NepR